MLDPILQNIRPQLDQDTLAVDVPFLDPGIIGVLQGSFDVSVITLSNILIKDEDTFIFFEAVADTFLGVDTLNVEILCFVKDNALQYFIKAALPVDWGFPTAFPSLPRYSNADNNLLDSFFADLPFVQPLTVLLSSYDFSATAAPADLVIKLGGAALYPAQIQRGLNFTSSINLTDFDLLSPIRTYLPAAINSDIPIIGSVTPQTGQNEIRLEIPIDDFTLHDKFDQPFQDFFNVGITGLVFYSSTFQYADRPRLGISLIGGISLGNATAELPENIEIQWPIGSTELIIRNTEEITFPGFDSFISLLDDVDKAAIENLDSPIIDALENLVVREFILNLSVSSPPVSFIRFGIGPPEDWAYPLLGETLGIDDMLLRMDIRPGGQSAFQFYALSDWKLAGGTVHVSSILPNMVFSGELGLFQTIALDQLVAEIIPHAPLPSVSIMEIALSADLKQKVYSFELDLASDWDLEIGGVSTMPLKRTRVSIDKGPDSTAVRIDSVLSIADIDLILLATNSGETSEGWTFEGHSQPGVDIPIGALMEELGTYFGIPEDDFPSVLESLVLENVATSFNTSTKNFLFSFEGVISDPIAASLLVDLQLTRDEVGGYQTLFTGKLIVGRGTNQRIFDLIFDRESQLAVPGSSTGGGASTAETNTALIALYQKPDGEKIPIADLLEPLAESLGLSDGDGISDLSFEIKSVLLVLDRQKITSPTSSVSVTKYLFSTEIDFDVSLAALGDLPIIGKQFAGQNALNLSFQPIISSSGSKETDDGPVAKILSDEELATIISLLPDGSPAIPNTLSGGLALATTVNFGSFSKVFNLGMSDGASEGDAAANGQLHPSTVNPELADAKPAASDPSLPANAAPGKPQSTDVNESFGALSISRLSLAYADGAIKVGLDGGLTLGPLEVVVFGLGASYTIATKAFSASLDGLGLSYMKPPLEINGAFFRFDRGDDPPDYVGEIDIKIEEVGMLAIGAFSEVNHKPSVFLYAFLDYPLGGPLFFFVDGLAFGFGYNRRLEVPPIDQLQYFPLVADAIGAVPVNPLADAEQSAEAGPRKPADMAATVRNKMELLAEYIYPQDGQYFLAVGLKFNSFKILESFALLTVGFGKHLDFAIMGVTRVSLPPETPIAEVFIEMVFSIRVDPEEGFIGANAILTNNSYVYSPLIRLTGGFAFYTWLKGPHEGDFVVTIGGYHPAFSVPAHYPGAAAVPRLGLAWKLSDYIVVKGEAYFATTPKAMMLGGRLVASFDSDPNKDSSKDSNNADPSDGEDDKKKLLQVTASFTAGVDFIMFWEPFHYEADAFVEIYAKLSLHTILGTISKSLSARADVNIWGPPFAGTARVKAKVIGIKVKFKVDLGDGKKTIPAKVSWDAFSKKFLPENLEDNAISINIQKGLVATIKEAGAVDGEVVERWVVNAKELQIVVSSVIPTTSAAAPVYVNPVVGNRVISPNGLSFREAPAPLQASMEISLTENTNDTENINDVAADFTVLTAKKQYPKALWTDTGEIASAQPGINGEQVIQAQSGYLIMPKVPAKALATHGFEVSELAYSSEDHEHLLTVTAEGEFSFTPIDMAEAIEPSVLEQAAANRINILKSLGFKPGEEVQLKSKLFDSFTYAPQSVRYQTSTS